MRIQHNIMAMNAYRNYNNNTKALSGNLEKLSSGYKINRAGDDAAGLAISEKMRAQITGLNAAQKNVKDGISLVKTAEGAMQEIQDMLNRMDYLATQSANGTYDSDVDRANLQKEVKALKEEIDRIADSANFNGIKLLDGSLDSAAAEKAQKAVDAAQAALDKANAMGAEAKSTPQDVSKLILAGESTDVNQVGKSTIVEVDAAESKDPSFKISFDGVKHSFGADNGAAAKNLTLTIGAGTKTIQITEAELNTAAKALNGGTDMKKGEEVDGTVIAKAFADKVAATGFEDDDGKKWKVEADGDTLKFTYNTAAAPGGNGTLTSPLNKHFNVKLESDVDKGDVAPTKNTFESGTYAASADGDGSNAKFTVTVTDKDGTDATYTTAALGDKATAADVLQALKDADDGNGNALSEKFDITENGGKFTFTAKDAGADVDAVTAVDYTASTNKTTGTVASVTDNGAGATDGTDLAHTGLNGYVNHGTEEVVVSSGAVGDLLASTTLDLTGLLKDGTQVKLGDTTYTIVMGDDSPYKKGGANEVLVAKDATEADIASALSVAAKDNATFTVSHEGTTAKIGLKQKAGVKDTTDMSTRDKIAGFIGVSVVSDADAAAAKAEAIKKATAELEAAKAAAAKKNGKDLTLQIGDTSDDFNQMGVAVGDMHVSAMFGLQRDEDGNLVKDADGNTINTTDTISSIDISTQDGATAAINVIKDAINYVSGVRGDLGAIQNRLDHTANNLSVMAENIQDAESTIRDTDVADEMMSYVKNNILVQSAQAMLAQANQVPQGVLQLLG